MDSKECIQQYYDELKNKIDTSGKQYDLPRIRKAYDVALRYHGEQRRISGEPYIIHPLAVAGILVDLGMDTDTIAAALLHDVVEDTPYTLEDVTKNFGSDIALLVDGVTKLGKIPFSTREEEKAENVRKMLLAMSQDIRVMLIKLADRLHNLRTLAVRSDDKRREKALETMEVFAPIAHRLGIRAIKEELEDLSLKYLDPVAYREIENALALRKEERKKFVDDIKERIGQRIGLDHEDIKIEGRVKSIYGIYRKMYMQGRNFEEIYDIYAVRIIVNTVTDCYNCLGVIHDMLTPIPNRFKDYISTPKPNGYQSLHTTVIGKESIPFEVQIRTWDMHYTAEYGVAAHWKYKEGIQGKDQLEERLAWVRQLLEAQQESEDVEDIIRTIKSDIAPEEVFVFTPKGDVISLPVGSTVIDFAYAIHSAVGNRMIGAKVDGRIVPFEYKVKTGQIVEILTTKSPNQGPTRDWLKIVRTGEARNKIRAWFKKEKREENIVEGRGEVEREFRRNNIVLTAEQAQEFLLDIAHRQHCDTIDDFFAAIGYGGINLQRMIQRIKDEYTKRYHLSAEPEPVAAPVNISPHRGSRGVIVEGIDNCLVKFSKCCNPVPGDEIVGFITRGYGVSVHKKDCINVISAQKNGTEPERWIGVHWANNVQESFKSTIEIVAINRPSILADVSIQLANMRLPIHALNARELKNHNTYISVTVAIGGLEQLNSILSRLSKIDGVVSVQRANI